MAYETQRGKRKRTREKHSVKDRTSSKKRKGSGSLIEKSVVDLEEEITQSAKNYNNIATLYMISISTDRQAKDATVALCRVFCRLIADGKLSLSKTASRKEGEVVAWLKARFATYVNLLWALMQNAAPREYKLGLTLSMQIVREELAVDDGAWHSGTFSGIVRTIILADMPSDVVNEFARLYMLPYDDVLYYTLRSIGEIFAHASKVQAASLERALTLLAFLPPSPTKGLNEHESFSYIPNRKNGQRPAYKTVSSIQKQAQRAWSALLSKGPSGVQRKHVLQIMTESIVPWFADPIHLMDFLTDCFNERGPMALLALSGMFSLMTTRNLDYPSFYPKLYSLLDTDVLHSTHRSRFLRLLNEFLSSSHLPAALVASFIKRLSRLALHAPPAAIVAVFPLIYNLFQAHPTCTFMMHRVPRTKEDRQLIAAGVDDPFDNDEPDPMLTHAIDSCIWELVSLQSHYHPNVASLADIISQQFTKKSYNLEDFLDHSYHSLVSAELGKELKKPPVVEFEIPKHVFMMSDGDASLDILMGRIIGVVPDDPVVTSP